ncbi:hypothetical protein [Sulfobacillus harzensis]|uniref:Uncharacterized protein n=1 Tax=Sulfobacillus harzensis TaxID=2729629 RepID=A0A7Y0L442_9FIRM|nr:hypothetical protein [Sulfobacillus harzensis]NMP22962.1 hypothetical protein [Sulfobacillus harzensis]
MRIGNIDVNMTKWLSISAEYGEIHQNLCKVLAAGAWNGVAAVLRGVGDGRPTMAFSVEIGRRYTRSRI